MVLTMSCLLPGVYKVVFTNWLYIGTYCWSNVRRERIGGTLITYPVLVRVERGQSRPTKGTSTTPRLGIPLNPPQKIQEDMPLMHTTTSKVPKSGTMKTITGGNIAQHGKNGKQLRNTSGKHGLRSWKKGTVRPNPSFFCEDAAMLNTGAFLLRSSDWSRGFLQRVWGAEENGRASFGDDRRPQELFGSFLGVRPHLIYIFFYSISG